MDVMVKYLGLPQSGGITQLFIWGTALVELLPKIHEEETKGMFTW
jgi:hypothetical protein